GGRGGAWARGEGCALGGDPGAPPLVNEPPPAGPDEAEVHGAAKVQRLGGPRVDAAAEGGDLEDLEVRVRDADDPAGVHGDALAGDRVVLEHEDPHAAAREEERDRQAVDPGADDDDVPRARGGPRLAPLKDLAFGHRRSMVKRCGLDVEWPSTSRGSDPIGRRGSVLSEERAARR